MGESRNVNRYAWAFYIMKIYWIPEEFSKTPGKLGITPSPGSLRESTEAALHSLKQQGVYRLICLQESFELQRFEPPETLKDRALAVKQAGMRFTHEPVEDFQAPTLSQVQRVVDGILQDLESGKNIVVHCWAGLGRAGTLAACVLVAKGMHATGSIEMVRWCRSPGAIQSEAQEKIIHRFAYVKHHT